MKKLGIVFIMLMSMSAFAQLKPGSKVFLEFAEIEGEVNVEGEDALSMLLPYVKDKTKLKVVATKEEAEFVFVLSAYELNMGNRKGKIVILDAKTNEMVFDTGLEKASSSAYYGYSGTRALVGELIKKNILKEYPKIKK
jgi:hypothetical protein